MISELLPKNTTKKALNQNKTHFFSYKMAIIDLQISEFIVIIDVNIYALFTVIL
jgi:hypothetical protein